MPETTDDQKSQSTMEWAKEKYNEQYEAWMPWLEDTFLKYFTKDNRTSYAARVTGIAQADALQDSVNDLAASQVGQNGLLEPVGDITSEAMKRAEHDGTNTNTGINTNTITNLNTNLKPDTSNKKKGSGSGPGSDGGSIVPALGL